MYSSELDQTANGVEPEILLQDRLAKGKELLDRAIEALVLLCEPVDPPGGELEHIHYFCGNTEIESDLEVTAPRRVALYKATVALVRAYANIADELDGAGYNAADVARLQRQLAHYLNVREIIRRASGESLDLKAYEADMRHLIDTYIAADEARVISPSGGMSLMELIVKTGIADAIAQQLGTMKGNTNAIAETIENNVRSTIIKAHLSDPAYFEEMSALLAEIIADRRAKAIDYEEYLRRIGALANQVQAGQSAGTPSTLTTAGKRALWNNLGRDELLALQVDAAVLAARPDDWRGILAREQIVKRALYNVLQDHGEVERIFLIIKAQVEY